MFQGRYAELINRQPKGFDQWCLDAYERGDSMSHSERQAVLRQFDVQVTLWKRDHDPRFTVDVEDRHSVQFIGVFCPQYSPSGAPAMDGLGPRGAGG